MHRYLLPITVLYGFLIIYASLFPFSGWRIPQENPFAWLTWHLPHHVYRKDAAVNLLAYIPFGFFASAHSMYRTGRLTLRSRVIVAGFSLSLSMEALQMLLPMRNPSLVDLFTNTGGTAIGAALALLLLRSVAPEDGVDNWREQWLAPGPDKIIGVGILLLWALSRLSPFVPTLSRPGPLKAVRPLWLSLHGKIQLNPEELLTHCCYAAGLALLANAVLHREVRSFRLFTAFAAFILTLRIFIFDGYLSLEVVIGYLAGIAAATLIARCPGNMPLLAAMGFLAAGIVLFEIKHGETAEFTKKINWIPFRYHLDNTLAGIGLIFEGVWPFSGLSLLWLLLNPKRVSGGLVYGGTVIFLIMALLEWQQQYIPGRTADITQALLALNGWSWPFFLMWRSENLPHKD